MSATFQNMEVSEAGNDIILPENRRPKPEVAHAQPSPCGTSSDTPCARLPSFRNGSITPSGTGERCAFRPVDGSPTAGGITPVQRPNVSSQHQLFDLTLGHRRTRSSESLEVFNEFADERSRSRGQDRAPLFSSSSAAASTATSSTGRVETSAAAAAAAETTLQVHDDEASTQEVPVPRDIDAAAANVELMSDGSSDVEYDPEQENTPVERDVELPNNPGAVVFGTDRAPLREFQIPMPADYEEPEGSDIESSDDEFESENLAEQLEERIQQNVSLQGVAGFYDFPIWQDP